MPGNHNKCTVCGCTAVYKAALSCKKCSHSIPGLAVCVCMLLSQRGWQRQFCRSRLIISDDRWIPCRVSLCVSIFCSFMCLFLWHRGYVSCVPACYDSSSIVVLIKIFTLCGCREWVKCKHCHWTGFTWYFLSIEFFGGLLSGWLCPAHLSPPFPAG